MLVSPDDRAVHQGHGLRVALGQNLEDPQPDAGLGPSVVSIVGRRIGAVALWQIAPWRPRSQDVEDHVEHTPVIRPGHTAVLVGQERRNLERQRVRSIPLWVQNQNTLPRGPQDGSMTLNEIAREETGQ
jgi:hypothetical protein